MGEIRNAYKTLVGKPERKRPLGEPRHRWQDNIRMDLRPGRETDHSSPSSTEVKNAWFYTTTPPIPLHGMVLSQAQG
jgi:hypothetical protein